MDLGPIKRQKNEDELKWKNNKRLKEENGNFS